jgi:N-acetylglucosaminyl-diphospho-decaprenol L-rhamnosyltransferase
MTTATPQVSVVVVTFSPGASLHAFLTSLDAATTRPYEVIMVDNGSIDGAPEAAANEFTGLRLIHTGGNLGYGRAANLGIAASDADWVVVANPDVIWTADSLDELLVATQRWPKGASFGPLIRTESGAVYPSARELPSLGRGIGHAALGWWWPANRWTVAYRREHEARTEEPVGWLSGACILLRRAAIDVVGGFDAAYFMYFEDTDLGDRLGQAGWRNVYVPTAEVTHIGGLSTREHSEQMLIEHHRSARLYLSRQYSGWQWFPLRVAMSVGLAARSFVVRRAHRARPNPVSTGGDS